MRKGLRIDGSYVGKGIVVKDARSGRSRITLYIGIMLVSALIIGSIAGFSLIKEGGVQVANSGIYRESSGVLGRGNYTPDVSIDSTDGEFGVLWYGYDNHNQIWNLNVTYVYAQDGSVYKTVTISNDINVSYGKPTGVTPKIAWDSKDDVFLVIWYSKNKSLDGAILDADGNEVVISFVINSTVKVDPHSFGLAYNSYTDQFIVVWSDTGYYSWYRTVMFNSDSTQKVTMGEVTKFSADRYHINHAAAYDGDANHVLIVFRNTTNSHYNITGKVIDEEGNTVKNDFTIADGYSDGKSYNMPNVAGGDGYFFVAYATFSSPYEVYGAIIDANTGDLVTRMDVGPSYYNVKYYGLGVAYNGSGGFVVTWPDDNKDIVAALYNVDGVQVWKNTIASGDSNQAPRVSVYSDGKNYQFVWYDSTTGEVKMSFWNESELIPEFGSGIVMVTLLFAVLYVRRKLK